MDCLNISVLASIRSYSEISVIDIFYLVIDSPTRESHHDEIKFTIISYMLVHMLDTHNNMNIYNTSMTFTGSIVN